MIWILIVVAVLIFLCAAPVCVEISYLLYKEQNRLKIKAGILFPFAVVFDSTKKKQKDTKNDKSEKDEEKKLLKQKIDFDLICDILREAGKLFGYFRKKLKIIKLKLHFHIGTEDAAATGIATGAAWGALYDIAAVLDHNFNLKEKNIHVSPDFTAAVFETDIKVRLSVRVIFLLIFAGKTFKSIKKLNLI